MDSSSCDVLIVGGGPAGSSCAWGLRGSGLEVLVMDAKAFPRDKVCAGWVTPQVVRGLDLDLADYQRANVLQPIRGFRVGMAGGPEANVDYGEVVSYGIRRCEFDHYLLRRAGAPLRLGEPLKTLRRAGGDWIANESIRAPLVVGAGGHFCPVASRLADRPRGAEPIVAAQEVEVELDPEQSAACTVNPELPELFFEEDLKGYGWLVRKGSWLNVGLGRQDRRDLSSHVERLLVFLRESGKLPPGDLGRLHGHAYLLYGQAPRPLRSEGALLIGDAAGLAYPRSGEGIRPAVESGLLAARAILDAGGAYGRDRLEPYENAMVERFGPRDGSEQSELSALIPAAWRPWVSRQLLGNRSFARHIVLDRWFLHRGRPALLGREDQASRAVRGHAARTRT